MHRVRSCVTLKQSLFGYNRVCFYVPFSIGLRFLWCYTSCLLFFVFPKLFFVGHPSCLMFSEFLFVSVSVYWCVIFTVKHLYFLNLSCWYSHSVCSVFVFSELSFLLCHPACYMFVFPGFCLLIYCTACFTFSEFLLLGRHLACFMFVFS